PNAAQCCPSKEVHAIGDKSHRSIAQADVDAAGMTAARPHEKRGSLLLLIGRRSAGQPKLRLMHASAEIIGRAIGANPRRDLITSRVVVPQPPAAIERVAVG